MLCRLCSLRGVCGFQGSDGPDYASRANFPYTMSFMAAGKEQVLIRRRMKCHHRTSLHLPRKEFVLIIVKWQHVSDVNT